MTTSQLANPDRLMVEVRNGPPSSGSVPTATPPAGPTAGTTNSEPASPSTPAAPLPDAAHPGPMLPARNAPKPVAGDDLAAAEMVTAEPSKSQLGLATPANPAAAANAAAAEATPPEPLPNEPLASMSAVTAAASAPPPTTGAGTPSRRDSAPAATLVPSETPKAARRTSSGDTSLVRALGLKISRVVIDPGHGGHDQGTTGAHGLLEKDLVLDVAQRVGKLIEEKMGAEVIYTRTDDTFIPLEGRTALANEKKADLFLSIHANSSPVAKIAGVETYYLNFPDTKDAIGRGGARKRHRAGVHFRAARPGPEDHAAR